MNLEHTMISEIKSLTKPHILWLQLQELSEYTTLLRQKVDHQLPEPGVGSGFENAKCLLMCMKFHFEIEKCSILVVVARL